MFIAVGILTYCTQDECNGQPIAEFIGLRSKSYSVKLAVQQPGQQDQKIASAGVKKKVAKRDLTHEKYREALFGKDVMVQQNSIRSFKHDVYQIRQTKIGLSNVDDKRYVEHNGIITRAHGHWFTKLENGELFL